MKIPKRFPLTAVIIFIGIIIFLIIVQFLSVKKGSQSETEGAPVPVPILALSYLPTQSCLAPDQKLDLTGTTASTNTTSFQPPKNAIDGNVSETKWQPQNTDSGVFLTLDLGKTQTFTALSIFFNYLNRPESYHIDISKTGSFSGEQSRLITETAALTGFEIYETGKTVERKNYFFAPATARFIRFTIDLYRNSGPSTTGQVNLYELELFQGTTKKQCLDQTITGDIGIVSTASMADPLSEIRARVDHHMQKLIEAIKQGSSYHGNKDATAPAALNPYVLEMKEFLEPIPASTQFPSLPDYRGILNRVNICNLVDNLGVRQVWMWGYRSEATAPKIVPDGSNMSMGRISRAYWNMPQGLADSKFKVKLDAAWGDVSNSSHLDDLPTCNNTYVLYNPTYTPSYDKAVESFVHQIENVMAYAAGEDSCDFGGTVPEGARGLVGNRCLDPSHTPNLFWDLFAGGQFYANDSDRRCGHALLPPNSHTPYGYNDKTLGTTTCEDWQPDGPGKRETFNCDSPNKWDCQVVPFYIWWMQHLPGQNNHLTWGGIPLRNWWDFMANFDSAIAQGKSLEKKW